MVPWVVPLEKVPSGGAATFGPKAVSLAELHRAGFPVPRGFCVSGEAFAHQARRVLGEAWWRELESLEGRADACGVALERRARLVMQADLPKRLRLDLGAAVAGLGAATPLAVRSSSTAEDGLLASAAGLQESLLGITGPEAAGLAVKRVWASLFSERTLAYLSRVARPKGPVLVAVVVQELVRPDVAGVMFTVNPVTGSDQEILINCAFGLGEPVLSGRISPDSFVVDKRSLEVIGRSIAPKRSMVTAGAGGLRTVALEEPRASAPSLDDEAARAVGRLGCAVEGLRGTPRDIEWALERGTVHLLQDRPVTVRAHAGARSAPVALAARARHVWTNANVGEALPGVVTPLTWSVAAAYSDRGFRRAFGALGCEVPAGAVLVGRFHGRIYLDLTEFVRIGSQVPLLSSRALAELGGGERLDDHLGEEAPSVWTPSVRFVARAPLVLARLAAQNLGLARSVERVERDVAAKAGTLSQMDLERLDGRRLRRELDELDRLLESTGDAMLTCGANSLGTFLLLRFLLSHWVGAEGARLAAELVAGARDFESAKPGIALWHIAETIRGEPESERILCRRSPSDLRVEDFPPGSATRRALHGFMSAYGYRAVREAEIMTPRWSEDPTLVFATLQGYLRSESPPPGRRPGAEAARRDRWGDVEPRLPKASRLFARHVVESARRYARLRERLRARVTQVLGMYRAVALEASRRLGSADVVFFLTIDELRRVLDGDLDVVEPVAAARRREHGLNLALPDPPSTFVGQPPPAQGALNPQLDHIEGVAASGGRASGAARVLRDPSDAHKLSFGDILVVPCADVGWSPLFLLAGAVVTDLGGVLSHAAVVAREYGVPAVFNARGATRRIADGQYVTVDGNTGLVFLHDGPVGPS